MSLFTRWAGSQIPSFCRRSTFSLKPVPQTPTEHWSTGSPNHWNGHRELLHFSKRVARCISASASDSSVAAALAVCGEVKPSKPCVVQALKKTIFQHQTELCWQPVLCFLFRRVAPASIVQKTPQGRRQPPAFQLELSIFLITKCASISSRPGQVIWHNLYSLAPR